MKEAERYRVLPIDDRSIERFDPAMAGRPDLMAGRKSLTVYEGMTGMMENAFINVKNQSVTITADVEIPAGGANGVILARAAASAAGACTSRTASRPTPTTSSACRSTRSTQRAARAGQGDDHARLRLRRQRPRQGRNGDASPSTASRSASGRVERTNANIFSADDAADVGVDEGTNVSSAYKQHGNKFTGRIEKVRVDVK